MNEREFCYWLQGLFEVGDVKSLDENQVQIVKDHLALVFNKVTPQRRDTDVRDVPLPYVHDRFKEAVRPLVNPMNPFPWVPPGQTRITCSGETPKNLIAIC